MPVVEVEDLSLPALRDYRSLTDVQLRRVVEPAEGLFMAEGHQVIRRALAAGHRVRSMLCAPRLAGELGELAAEAGQPDATIFVAERDVLEAVTGFDVHRGALAAMHRPALRPIADVVAGLRRIAVLEDLVDHANVGAVFRSAAALGVEALLVTPRCADPLYRRSVRVSMGNVFQVPWTQTGDWPATLPELHDLGFTTAALALTPTAITLDALTADPPDRLCWILGTEGDGLSPTTIAAATHTVEIPMTADVSSLNVAAAAAVAFWATRLA